MPLGKMLGLATIVNGSKSLTFVAKHSMLDVFVRFGYFPDAINKFCKQQTLKNIAVNTKQ